MLPGKPRRRPRIPLSPQSFSAILFDLDGTLVDSVELIVRSFEHAARAHLGAAPSRAALAATIGRPLASVLEELAPGRGEQLVATYRAYLREHHDALVRPFPGAVDTLRELRARGYRLGIVTAKGRPQAELAFRLCALEPLVDVTVCAEDTTRHKPAPEPLLKAAADLGIPPARCLYVGDSTHDLIAARAAGMRSAAAPWGAGAAEALAALAPELWLGALGDLPFYCPPLPGRSRPAATGTPSRRASPRSARTGRAPAGPAGESRR